MSKEQKRLENKVDSNLLQGSIKKSDGTHYSSHGTRPGAEVFSESSSDREDHRSTNKTDKKKVVQVSPRNSPPELIHYLKDRHGPKRKDDNSPPQLLPEIIVTRTKLNKEKLSPTDLLSFSKKGKWDGNNLPDMPPEVKQEAIRSSPKSKKKYGQKSPADEYSNNEPQKNSVQISLGEPSERNESVVEIQRRLILDLQEKQKKLRQHEKIKKTNDRMDRIFHLPKFSIPAETTSILPSETDVSSDEKRRAVTCKSSSTDGDSVASKNEKIFNYDVEESLESLVHEPEYSSDIQDANSLVDFEDWITEEEVEDVDDELFTTPQHVSTGKEERDLIDGVEILSFETEHDMVEFTKIELDFKGVIPHDDFVAQSDDGLDMVDDSFVYSESDTLSATQAIVPTKTKDITKIKGWRTKQFAVNDNPNPMLGHCSSTYGICEDDDGFGSCDVKLGEELSLDVNEDHKWDGEEQEDSSSTNIREKVSAERLNKSANEEAVYNSAFGMSSDKKSNPLKEDVLLNTLPPAQSKVNKYPKEILKEEKNEKSYVECSLEDEKRTRLSKPSKSFQSQVDSQTRLSMRNLQKHGRKPKTLAEKRMLMELEQKRKDMCKRRKRLKRRPRRPKRRNKENNYKSNDTAIEEQNRPRIYEFRKRLKNSFTADNDSEEFSDNDEYLEDAVLDETKNKVISSSKAGKSQRSKYDLDKNYCYYWHQGKPIRLAGSHKNQETEEERLLGNEDHSVDSSLYDSAIPGLDVDIRDTVPKKTDLETPTEVSTCNGTVVEDNASDSFEYSLIVNPTVGTPLVPLAVSQLELLRSNSQYIDENWARFAASVVVSRDWRKNPLPRNRIVLPMRISNLRKEAMLDVPRSKSSNPVTKLPPSFQSAPTGLRLVRPMQPLGSETNILSPRFGPLGSSSVRMRYPKPPTLKGIRTIPGSVRLNPIVSETKTATSSPSPPPVNNKPPEKQKSKKEPQLVGKRGKARISNWKAKLNNLTCSVSMPMNDGEIDNEVQNVVQGIVNYVVLREVCDSFIDDDPDVNEPHPSEHQVSPSRGKYKKKKALFRELSKLDVTVIDMDMHENSGETKEDSSKETCNQEYCKLGCVCGSLQVCKSLFPQHCGLVQCMFGCKCDVPTSSAQDKDKSHVLSEEAILSLQNKNSRFLAKEEKEFRHTVIRAKDEMIIVGGDGTVRRKREIKLPGRYRDSYMTLGVGLSDLKLSVEDVDQPRRSGRSLNTVEYITPSVGKKLIEKKLPTVKEPCNVMACQVKLEKLDFPEDCVNPLCMDHSTYTCNCFKYSETCLKGDSSCGETNYQKLDTLSLHECNNSIILKQKPGIMQVSSSSLEHKEEDIVIVKSEAESCVLSTEMVNETRSHLKSKHKLDALPSPLNHTEVPSFNTTISKLPVLKKESSVSAAIKQRSKLSTKPSVESSKRESKKSAFLKSSSKSSSSKQSVIQETLNDLPLLKCSKIKSRNVAVKSTARPPTSNTHAHDIFQHSARTALPSIDYRMRNLSQFYIRRENGNACQLEMFHNAASELCNSLKSDAINPVPCTEIKEEAVPIPEIIPEDSSEIIGKIESVTTLSVEEFHRVETGVEIEENISFQKKSTASPKQFKMKSNLLQCTGSSTTNENVRNLTAEELEILLQKSECRQQTNPEDNEMHNENSINLLHFPLVKNLFNSGHIQLWFSRSGSGSKLIMTASKEKPGEAYVNLKDISMSKPIELPELISDILKKPDPSSVSSSSDTNDECNTYVLLRFNGKSFEVGRTMGDSNSHFECSEDLITYNVESQNIDGLLASQEFLNKERLAFGGEILKSGERISNGSSEHRDFTEPLSVTISGSKSSSIPKPIDKQKNDTICEKLSRSPGCSKESNNSAGKGLCITDGGFPKTTALHTKQQDFMSDTNIREISPKEENTKVSADGYVRSLDIPAVKLNEVQELSKLGNATEHIPVLLENDRKNSTSSKENCKESKLKQLQLLSRFKNAIITSKIRKIPEKQLKTSDVEQNEIKSLPVPVSDECDGSDTTVKIPLPTCKGCRWYVLSTDNKFDIMFSKSRQCSVKFEQILEAISVSERQKETVCLPFAKSQGDSVAAGYKKPKFGIYAVSGITNKVFIGPYSHSEDSCLAFYKRSADGGYMDAYHVEKLNEGCSGMEKSKPQKKKEYLDDKLKQVSCKQNIIIVKDVWLYSPEEMIEEKTVENCLTKSKIVQEECLSSGMNRQGDVIESANVTSALETTADNIRETNEIKSLIKTPSQSKELEKLQNLAVTKRRRLNEENTVFDRVIPTEKSLCKAPDNQSVIHVGNEIPCSDAEDLDIETVSDDTSSLKLERTGVPLKKHQNIIILPSGTKCAIQKPKFKPIQPAPPVTGRQDSEDSSLPVKLIPSVKNIGYICATYFVDGKVIFRHPIERVKVSFSSMVAANQWLQRLLQFRIRYIPKQLRVTWKLVSQTYDCQGLEPFKTDILNGDYILTVRGLFNLKEISAGDAINYGLRYGDVIRLQEKRNRRDLQEGFNKLRKLLAEKSNTPKLDLLLQARENVLCLKTTGKMLEKKKRSLQVAKNNIFQRLGNLMKEMTSIDKKDTLLNMKKLLEELNTRTSVPVVELDGDSDPEAELVNSADQSVIELSGSESDLEDYLSDGSSHSEGVKKHNAEKKWNDAESHNKSDDSSISISVVKDVHNSNNQKEHLAHNDDVTVTCIPLTSSPEVRVKREIDSSFGDISISRERLLPSDLSKEKVVGLYNRDIGRTNVQDNLPSSDVEMEEPHISAIMKRKRSKSVDDDVVIFGSSSKKSCSNEKVSSITVSTPSPLLEPSSCRWRKNITVWPYNDSKMVLESNSDLESAVPMVKKESANVEVVKLGASSKKSPSSFPCGINIFNNSAAKRISNFKIISGKIEPGNISVGCDANKGLQVSKVSSETVNKPVQSPLFMRLVKSPIQNNTDMDRGLNFLKVGSQSVKTPLKLTIHSKLQSDDGKQPSSNIGTHSKTSLKYVYSPSGEKMYVNGPSGPLPLVVATRAPSSSQDESKRTMTLTVSKPKYGSSPNVPIPNSPVKSVNSDNSASVDALKIPVKKPSVPVAQTQAQGGVTSTNLPHVDVPVILEKKDVSHSESLMKWVANNDSSDQRIPKVQSNEDDTVHVATDS